MIPSRRLPLIALAIAACLSGFPLTATAQTRSVLSLYQIPDPGNDVMRELAGKFEVLKRGNGGYEILLPANRATELSGLVPKARLVEADIHDQIARLGRDGTAGYHTFDTVVSDLKQIATAHPDMVSIQQYGFSQESNALWVLTLTKPGGAGPGKPAVMLTGATHGNELISTEVIFGEINALINGYGKDQRLTALVDSHVLYFVPVVNPDGYLQQDRYSNGVDPNREYPYPDLPSRNPNACIQAIMGFVAAHPIVGSLDYHSYGELVMYPWAYTDTDAPDVNAFDALTQKMADPLGYTHGQISRILYSAPGSSADYYYWKFKTVGVAIEIGTEFVPPASQMPQVVQQQLEPAWEFIESFR